MLIIYTGVLAFTVELYIFEKIRHKKGLGIRKKSFINVPNNSKKNLRVIVMDIYYLQANFSPC